MGDTSATEFSRPADHQASGGDPQIEHLLLAGLDHYFAGEYERAISVWTRVLFLDRAHPRARAYIERARSALAERQREGEELVHRGVDAFSRGDTEAARQLLTTGLEHGGPQDTALAILDRLDRLQVAAEPAPPVPATRHVRPPPVLARHPLPVRLPPRRIPVFTIVVIGLILAGLVFGALSSERLVPILAGGEPEAGASRPKLGPSSEPLPVPAPGELALGRARALMGAGHLREALKVLDTIPPGNARRPDADRLTAEIQRTLIASTRFGSPGRSGQ